MTRTPHSLEDVVARRLAALLAIAFVDVFDDRSRDAIKVEVAELRGACDALFAEIRGLRKGTR